MEIKEIKIKQAAVLLDLKKELTGTDILQLAISVKKNVKTVYLYLRGDYTEIRNTNLASIIINEANKIINSKVF